MRKQYHFWPATNGDGLDAWDVERLIALTAGRPVVAVPLADIAEIDRVYWFDRASQLPTVRSVVEHIGLIRAADLSYPVSLGSANRVLDGMHRIAKCLLEARDSVSAVYLDPLPPPDFRSCHPESLPYD